VEFFSEDAKSVVTTMIAMSMGMIQDMFVSIMNAFQIFKTIGFILYDIDVNVVFAF